MRVFISADIEGVGCVVRGENSSPGGREYPMARRLMTEEVNAAIRACYESGADSVVVADAHNVGLNLLPEDLDERAELIMGSPRPLSMMHGVKGADAALFVGYHAMAGTADGSICHTYMGRIASVKVNGLAVGEIGLNLALAGACGVQVAALSGDRAACNEILALDPEMETAAVKTSIGAYAAHCLHPKRCRDLIFKAVRKGLDGVGQRRPYLVQAPVTLEVGLTTASGADRVEALPGVCRISDKSLRFEADDFLTCHQTFGVMATLLDEVHFI